MTRESRERQDMEATGNFIPTGRKARQSFPVKIKIIGRFACKIVEVCFPDMIHAKCLAEEPCEECKNAYVDKWMPIVQRLAAKLIKWDKAGYWQPLANVPGDE